MIREKDVRRSRRELYLGHARTHRIDGENQLAAEGLGHEAGIPFDVTAWHIEVVELFEGNVIAHRVSPRLVAERLTEKLQSNRARLVIAGRRALFGAKCCRAANRLGLGDIWARGVVMVKRVGGPLGAIVAVVLSLILSVITAYAAEVTVNRIYSPGQIVSSTAVDVAAKATCDPIAGLRQANFAFRLVEATANGTTTGTGSSGRLTCDGSEHRYDVVVNATSAWVPGSAQVYVATDYEPCTANPSGPPNCVGNATPYKLVTTIQLEARS